MVSPVLERIRTKITRADNHIADLKTGEADYFKTNPIQMGIRAEGNEHVHYVASVDPLPDILETISSDAIHNLTSALDQLAYQIVLYERQGVKPNWNVYYPITKLQSDYEARRGGMIKGVRRDIINAIDATQPFKGGRGHALWQLKELRNSDDHLVLIEAMISSQGWGISYGELFAAEAFQNMGIEPHDLPPLALDITKRTARVGDEILRQEIVQGGPQLSFGFNISFNAPGVIEGEPAVGTLRHMSHMVRQIADSFEPFFGP